jgi:hypothetical protein
MRFAPDWFVSQLKQEHDGRLRIRWSPVRFRWQIEQKTDVARLAPFKVDPGDDDAIRAMDGYTRICEISPGTITPCTNIGPTGKMCGHDLRAPYAEFKQVRCPACRANGFHGGNIVAHFELNDHLLQHLRRIDPNRGAYEATRKSLRTHNKDVMNARYDSVSKELAYMAVDDMRLDIPKRGYTGKESMWLNAPTSKF